MNTNLNLVRRLTLGIQKTAAEAPDASWGRPMALDEAKAELMAGTNPNAPMSDHMRQSLADLEKAYASGMVRYSGGVPIAGGMVTPARYAPAPVQAPSNPSGSRVGLPQYVPEPGLSDVLQGGLGELGAATGRGAAAVGNQLVRNYTDPRLIPAAAEQALRLSSPVAAAGVSAARALQQPGVRQAVDAVSPGARALSTLAATARASQGVADAGAATDRYNKRAAASGRAPVTKKDIGSNMDVPQQVLAEGARRAMANNPIVAQQRMAQQAGRKIGDTGVALGRRLMNWMDRAYGGTGR